MGRDDAILRAEAILTAVMLNAGGIAATTDIFGSAHKPETTMHYLLFYDVVPNYAERRVPFRAAHLAYAWAAVERGELVLGGALAEPIDGAVLLFKCESADVVAFWNLMVSALASGHLIS